MKKILFIMKALYIGGAEKQYRMIIESIEDNCELTVVLLNTPSQEQREQTKRYIHEHNRVRFVQLKGTELVDERTGSIRNKIKKTRTLGVQWFFLRKYLKKHSFDFAMYSYVTQLLMTPMLKKHGIKVVFNERNTGRQICDSRIKKSLLKGCDRVIANSKYASKYIEKETGKKVAVFNNGLEQKSITKQRHDGFNIFVPARVTRIKNQELVIDALSILPVDRDIHVDFAGVIADEQYYLEMKKKIDVRGLDVTFHGYCEDVETLYGKADLVVLPSFEEGTPNVLLESYMYGIMPLVSSIPMNRACCLDSRVLFSPNNEKELAEKIDLIRKDSLIEDKEAYLQANYEFVINTFGMDNMRLRYLKLFELK